MYEIGSIGSSVVGYYYVTSVNVNDWSLSQAFKGECNLIILKIDLIKMNVPLLIICISSKAFVLYWQPVHSNKSSDHSLSSNFIT